jgi:hypothetical protein
MGKAFRLLCVIRYLSLFIVQNNLEATLKDLDWDSPYAKKLSKAIMALLN